MEGWRKTRGALQAKHGDESLPMAHTHSKAGDSQDGMCTEKKARKNVKDDVSPVILGGPWEQFYKLFKWLDVCCMT